MSETTSTAEQQLPEQPAPAPAEPPPPPPPEEPAREASEEDSRWERRVNRLTSRVTLLSRQNEELNARLAQQAQQQANGGQQLPEDVQRYIQAEAARMAAAQRLEDKTAAFHSAGAEAYDDWSTRCQNLIAMGADPQMAQLLVEMPARVTGELADDPEALERITSIQSERGRAIALGKYAASIEARPARHVSRAPKPPTPVTARATPKFDEYTASADELVKHYQKQDMERRRQR